MLLLELDALSSRILALVEMVNSTLSKSEMDFGKLSAYKTRISLLSEEFSRKVQSAIALWGLAQATSEERSTGVSNILKKSRGLLQVVDEVECSLVAVLSDKKPESMDKQDGMQSLPKFSFREFDEGNPTLWFMELELQFSAFNIVSQKIQFFYLKGLLNTSQSYVVSSVTLQVEDLTTPFKDAKALLLKSYGMTVHQRLEKAFAVSELSHGEKPSQYLARFKLLIGEASLDDICQWHLKRALPEDVQLALSSNANVKSAEEMAEVSDALMASKGAADVGQVEVSVVKQNRSRKFKEFVLCERHKRYGENAWSCTGTEDLPCPMKGHVKPKQGNK